MQHELPLRIIIQHPPADVLFCLQRGFTEHVSPVRSTGADISFDLSVRVVTRPDGTPNFLGPFTQGPPNGRFVYVNSGRMAGDTDSCWDRRAKVHLKEIDWKMIEEALATPGAVLEARISGVARDGGPACATVPLLGGWRVVPSTINASL